MSKVVTTQTARLAASQFFSVICDYEKYPEFLSEVTSAKVISTDPKQVSFTVNLIKTFQYTLEFEELPCKEVSWHMVESNLFKKNSGSWKLEEKNGKVPAGRAARPARSFLGDGYLKVTYELDVEFGFFAPRMIVNAMVQKNMPRVVERFVQRASSCSGIKHSLTQES